MSNLQNLFDDNKFYTRLVLLGLIELANFVLLDSIYAIVITIIQLLIVFFCLFHNDYFTAFLFHIVFCLTGCDATSASTELQLYSYPEIKLFGPFTLSYIILGLFWLINRKNKSKVPKASLLYVFRKLLKLFLAYGSIIGVIGLLLFGYRISDFIVAFIYIFVGFLYVDTFCRCYDIDFLHKSKNAAYSLLIAAPFVSFFTYFILDIKAEYSVFDALIYNEEFMMAPILLICLFTEDKHKFTIFLSVILYAACVSVAGRGGFFLGIVVCLVYILYQAYFVTNTVLKYSRIIKIGFPMLVIIGGGAAVNFFLGIEGGQSLAGNKVMELISLFNALFTLGFTGFSLTDISASPYIRIAEVLNILDNGLTDPLGLVFGHGFGGVYTDSTGLFQNVDVSNGGFPDAVIKSGRYGTAHSFLPCTLLFNGIIGTFLLIKLGFNYLKYGRYTPLCFAGYYLFLYSFYFNPSLFLAAAFALFSSEYAISMKLNKKTYEYTGS